MHRSKVVRAVVAAVVALVSGGAVADVAHGGPDRSSQAADPRFLKADGPVLRNRSGTGDVVALRGTNLGGWLLQEGWMSPAGEARLDRAGWTASATSTEAGGSVQAVLDGDPATRWSSGRAQAPGEALTIDLGARRTFDQVSFDTGQNPGDEPRSFVVDASDDGSTWWRIAAGAGEPGRTTVAHGAQTARLVRVRLSGGTGNWWSVTEFHAYVSDEFNTRRVLSERFGAAGADDLIAGYQRAWITTGDLDTIRDTGMNVVRVPFDWQVLMRPDGTMRPDTEAFDRLDWLVREAGARGLYVILDFHGTPGAACPWQSCGRAGSNELWANPTYQDWTVRIWQRIAERYRGEAAIAAYDLLNEPVTTMGEAESAAQVRQKFDFYDRLHDAVREVDPDHAVIVEAFYTWQQALPPSEYGWRNVVYETHHYNFTAEHDRAAMASWIDGELAQLAYHRAEWNVPVYAGEFWLGPFDDLYTRWLTGLNEIQASWTSWTYKVKRGENWGLFRDTTAVDPDINLDPAATIRDRWAAFHTSSFSRDAGLTGIYASAARQPVHPRLPAVIQAESHVGQHGLRIETTADVGGGLDLGWVDRGDWADYVVDAPSAGTYRVVARVASPTGVPSALRLHGSEGTPATASVPSTGSWQTWSDVSLTVALQPGRQRLRLEALAGGWNINWLRVEPSPTQETHCTEAAACPPSADVGDPTPQPEPGARRARVVRALAGDTYLVRLAGGVRVGVRLLGLRTRPPGRGNRCGDAAAALARRLLPRGASVLLTSDPAEPLQDRRGRLLRYVDRSGKDVGRHLLRAGLGRVRGTESLQRGESYRGAQQAAQARRLGLWAPC